MEPPLPLWLGVWGFVTPPSVEANVRNSVVWRETATAAVAVAAKSMRWDLGTVARWDGSTLGQEP